MCNEIKMVEGIDEGIDACIADLVEALNRSGIQTFASCCGHGKETGAICLADGRNLLILSQQDVSKNADRAMRHLLVLSKPVVLFDLDYVARCQLAKKGAAKCES